MGKPLTLQEAKDNLRLAEANLRQEALELAGKMTPRAALYSAAGGFVVGAFPRVIRTVVVGGAKFLASLISHSGGNNSAEHEN